MKDFKRKYIKPEVVVYAIDNLVSLQTTSDTPPGELPREGSSSVSSSSTKTSNPFEENSFIEQ